MIAKPHTSSEIHHHGEENTIIYAAKGKGSVISEGGKVRHDLEAGDVALIPAFAEHQEVNESDADVVRPCIFNNVAINIDNRIDLDHREKRQGTNCGELAKWLGLKLTRAYQCHGVIE